MTDPDQWDLLGESRTDTALRRTRDVLVSLASLCVSVLVVVYLLGAWSIATREAPVPPPAPTIPAHGCTGPAC